MVEGGPPALPPLLDPGLALRLVTEVLREEVEALMLSRKQALAVGPELALAGGLGMAPAIDTTALPGDWSEPSAGVQRSSSLGARGQHEAPVLQGPDGAAEQLPSSGELRLQDALEAADLAHREAAAAAGMHTPSAAAPLGRDWVHDPDPEGDGLPVDDELQQQPRRHQSAPGGGREGSLGLLPLSSPSSVPVASPGAAAEAAVQAWFDGTAAATSAAIVAAAAARLPIGSSTAASSAEEFRMMEAEPASPRLLHPAAAQRADTGTQTPPRRRHPEGVAGPQSPMGNVAAGRSAVIGKPPLPDEQSHHHAPSGAHRPTFSGRVNATSHF